MAFRRRAYEWPVAYRRGGIGTDFGQQRRGWRTCYHPIVDMRVGDASVHHIINDGLMALFFLRWS